MDRTVPLILPSDLYDVVGTASVPIIVDVRSDSEIHAIDRLIPGAVHRPVQGVENWWRELPSSHGVVVCDLSGGEQGRRVVETLRHFGTDAGHLVDGFAGWYDRGLPTRKVVAAKSEKWVTREHPKIDRIACPWLVRRFINSLADFIYVPPDRVLETAAELNATPYDVKDVEFGHIGDQCSFDAIVRIHDIHDPALDHLATIVRGADTSRPDLAPQCEGLLAISYGLSANCPDDHEMLRHGMVIYDALYMWCRMQRDKLGAQ
jgi:rhodanese-related sulfurtransferase